MLVNSFIFWLFFITVLLLYFPIAGRKSQWQNMCLLGASYFFYGYIHVGMAVLLAVVTLVYYVLGHGVAKGKRASLWCGIGVSLGVGLLAYFKYANFLLTQVEAVFTSIGVPFHPMTLKMLVPVGISFFTFKLISYLVDVYKGKMMPVDNMVTFAAWVSFFPTIMSGPIDRAIDTVPQLEERRKWCDANLVEGLKRILWGMFLKMCIADKVAPYTDAVFNNYGFHSGLTIVVAAFLYSFQIYADFCGYSEMAIGVAKILGVKVPENFLRPYFSTNVGEVWRRWHMSLMSWFKDYIYIPLGGSRCSEVKTGRNTLAVFAVSGLWHGANWTFIFWGLYHGILVFMRRIWTKHVGRTNTKAVGIPPFIVKYSCIALTFFLMTLGWMLFRANSLDQFWGMLLRVNASGGLFFSWALTAVLPICILFFKELKDEEGWNVHFLHASNPYLQTVSMALLLVYIIYTGELEGAKFIYFQF